MIFRTLPLLFAALFLASCAEGPRDIAIGAEECAHCRMLVAEAPFAAQLRTEQGRTQVFDSIECMAEFVHRAREQGHAAPRAMWVSDLRRPGSWVSVDEAGFLHSSELRSPMGMNLSAYAGPQEAATAQREYGGDILDWAGVMVLVRQEAVVPTGHSHAH